MLHLLAAIGGLVLLVMVLVDAFNTLVLARRTEHVFRITRFSYWVTWHPYAALARRVRSSRGREAFLGVYGPLSVFVLFGLWALGLVIAFGLLQWAVHMNPGNLPGTLLNDLYLSGSTLVTLSHGDPRNPASKVIAVVQGGLGLGFLTMVISYLPVLYQSFSRRELQITLLDARAGSPPSAGALLQFAPATPGKLERQLSDWEEWSAQMLENHLSFPMLAYFRSQHSNQAWLTALVAVVDCAAVVSLCSTDDLQRQSTLTFAMGRHVLRDITKLFGLEEESAAHERGGDRLSEGDFAALQQVVQASPEYLDAGQCTRERLESRRRLYEPQASALSDYLLMTMPPWIADASSQRNWEIPISARGDDSFSVSDAFAHRSEGDE